MLNREFVTALAEKCPFYRAPLSDCPLARIRAEGESEGLPQRLERLSEDEVEELIRGHFVCMCRRDGCEV